MAEEVLKKIQKAEKEADEIILKANEESKNIAKETGNFHAFCNP